MLSKKPDHCRATCYGQQYVCARCGLTWDVGDDKPNCLTHREVALKATKAIPVVSLLQKRR